MKDYSTILEALEQKIEGIPMESKVKISEIIGEHKEKKIIAAARMLLMKYGIKYE